MSQQQQFIDNLSTLLDRMRLLDQSEMQQQLDGFKPAEVHTIEFIGKHANANLTKISAAMYVTRGAVSKMTKRLISRGLIEGYHKEGNQKDVYFQLTSHGQDVFDIHERLNQQFEQRDQIVFDQTQPDELEATLNFLKRYNRHLDSLIDLQKKK